MNHEGPARGQDIALRLVDLASSGEVPGIIAPILSLVALAIVFYAGGAGSGAEGGSSPADPHRVRRSAPAAALNGYPPNAASPGGTSFPGLRRMDPASRDGSPAWTVFRPGVPRPREAP